MKVLITGATGLIGSELTHLCETHAMEVHFLTTDPSKAIKEKGGFLWDPQRGTIELDCFKGVEAIVHLAGATVAKSWTKRYKRKILESRVASTELLVSSLREIEDHKTKHVICASAISIYPSSPTHYFTEEEAEVDGSFLSEVAQKWEAAADGFSKLGVPTAKVRIGLVLSGRGGVLPSMCKPVKNFVGAAFGSGEQWQSWIHIQDLARIFHFLLEKKAEGVFNGVSPNPVPQQKLIQSIAKVLKRPLLLPNIPKGLARMVLGERSYLVFASQRVSSKKIESAGFRFEFMNLENALRDLLQGNVSQG